MKLLKTYVWSILLYGCETWTITAETKKNLEAAEMWFYRRMLRIMERKEDKRIDIRRNEPREIPHKNNKEKATEIFWPHMSP